jgi:predicted RNA-binding Zn-ribbon protein involved in translation (DUF1610 family)
VLARWLFFGFPELTLAVVRIASQARVIYCQSRNDKSFAVGLELPASGHMTDAAKDWDLTVRYRCPACGKGYAVVEWKKSPKCRQCGAELRIDDELRKSPRQGR